MKKNNKLKLILVIVECDNKIKKWKLGRVKILLLTIMFFLSKNNNKNILSLYGMGCLFHIHFLEYFWFMM